MLEPGQTKGKCVLTGQYGLLSFRRPGLGPPDKQEPSSTLQLAASAQPFPELSQGEKSYAQVGWQEPCRQGSPLPHSRQNRGPQHLLLSVLGLQKKAMKHRVGAGSIG